MLSTAGGTAWALVFRTVSSPVGLREALRIYRREQTGKMLTSLRTKLPAPGVYTYRTSGGEGLNLVGVQRSFPSTTSMIVADGRCATVSWVPITQHTEATTVCSGPNGALEIPKLVTDESIAGTTSTSTIACPATAYLLPPSVRPGERWGVTCSLLSPRRGGRDERAGPRHLDDRGGRASRDRRTHAVLTHLCRHERGTNPTDFWIVPGNGLIVREQETVAVNQASVRYNETMETTLTSLSPALSPATVRSLPVLCPCPCADRPRRPAAWVR